MASINIDFPHGPKTVARTFTATGTYTPQGSEIPVVQLFDGTTALTPAGMVTIPLGGSAPFSWSAAFAMGADTANATLVAKLPTSGVSARETNITVSGTAPVIITPPDGGGGSPSFGMFTATLEVKGKKTKGQKPKTFTVAGTFVGDAHCVLVTAFAFNGDKLVKVLAQESVFDLPLDAAAKSFAGSWECAMDFTVPDKHSLVVHAVVLNHHGETIGSDSHRY